MNWVALMATLVVFQITLESGIETATVAALMTLVALWIGELAGQRLIGHFSPRNF